MKASPIPKPVACRRRTKAAAVAARTVATTEAGRGGEIAGGNAAVSGGRGGDRGPRPITRIGAEILSWEHARYECYK